MRIRGRAFVYRRKMAAAGTQTLGREAELGRFRAAFDSVRADLEASDGDVFAAHLEMLEDPMIAEGVESAISEGLSAVDAVRTVCGSVCSMFSEIDDEYLKARVDDVRDVCLRLENELVGVSGNPFADLVEGTVVVAEELLPSDTALMDFTKIAGLITAKGSVTSHVSIIARAKGIPALVGYDISGIADGDMVDVETGLDGNSLEKVRACCRTGNMKFLANAGSVAEIESAIAAGADGIGLFRTEFLFMSSESLPDGKTQASVYRSAILACQGRPLTIRTLDVGGDKPLPYLPMEKEDNPFLGLRGVRFTLLRKEIMEEQVGAVLAALSAVSEDAEAGLVPKPLVRLMFPMVDTLSELRQCRTFLPDPLPEGLEVGIMVETPSAVFESAELAAECDFFSLGTNDLTQYVMAADRGNAAVSYLYDTLSPAVRRAISIVVESAHGAGIHVGVCGEIASDPDAAAVLAGIGVDSLSVSGLAPLSK